MNLSDVLLHLIGFSVPALAMGMLMPLWARLARIGSGGAMAVSRGYWMQALVVSVAGWVALTGGLVATGRDGAMVTYGILVLVTATVQWALMRGPRT